MSKIKNKASIVYKSINHIDFIIMSKILHDLIPYSSVSNSAFKLCWSVEPSDIVNRISESNTANVRSNILKGIVGVAATSLVIYLVYTEVKTSSIVNRMITYLFGENKTRTDIPWQVNELAVKLNRSELELMNFTEQEISLFADVVAPDDIDVSFEDIGGINDEVEALQKNILLPLHFWYVNLFISFLYACIFVCVYKFFLF